MCVLGQTIFDEVFFIKYYITYFLRACTTYTVNCPALFPEMIPLLTDSSPSL